MTLRTICDGLRDLGVVEVILEIEHMQSDDIPVIEFHGEDGGINFKIRAANSDFAENGL